MEPLTIAESARRLIGSQSSRVDFVKPTLEAATKVASGRLAPGAEPEPLFPMKAESGALPAFWYRPGWANPPVVPTVHLRRRHFPCLVSSEPAG
jgi:hypothetical protein